MASEREQLNVMVVIASTRPVRAGLPVGTWIADLAREREEWNVTIADLKEIDLPLMNEPHHPRQRNYTLDHTKRWSALVDAQDAFIFVFPEYNHAMIAPLKNAIDYLVHEWAYKPVGIVSYGGMTGAVRAVAQVKTSVVPLKMMPLVEAVTIFGVGGLVQDGVFNAPEPAIGAADTMLTELRRWALALRPLRTGEI